MPAYEPEQCDLLLFKYLETGELDAAVALYEPDAKFVISPDKVVIGHAAIREHLQDFIETNATGKLDSVTAVASADGSIAFTRARGKSTSAGPDRKPVAIDFHTVEVVRRQSDGTWRIIIDDPSGAGLE
jgi:uncharacterized protein (TIGR02246 family)